MDQLSLAGSYTSFAALHEPAAFPPTTYSLPLITAPLVLKEEERGAIMACFVVHVLLVMSYASVESVAAPPLEPPAT